ncbi:MAG: class I SAM-dependent methyltransferase [Candidatus Dormiibacterota bacterium]
MADASTEAEVVGQYRDGTNLGARQDLYRRFGTARRTWQAWVFDQLRLPEGARILEVGGGSGRLWVENRERMLPGWRVTVTDRSPGMLAEAEVELAPDPTFRFAVARVEALPFADGNFEAVIANHMLYHVPQLQLALSEVHRVLAPRGVLIAATNGPNHLSQFRKLQTQIGTLAGPRTHPAAAFNLVTGPPQLQAIFASLIVKRHPEELRITDVQAVVAYLGSLPGPRLSSQQIEAVSALVEREVQLHGYWRVAVEAGLIRGYRRQRVQGPTRRPAPG